MLHRSHLLEALGGKAVQPLGPGQALLLHLGSMGCGR